MFTGLELKEVKCSLFPFVKESIYVFLFLNLPFPFPYFVNGYPDITPEKLTTCLQILKLQTHTWLLAHFGDKQTSAVKIRVRCYHEAVLMTLCCEANQVWHTLSCHPNSSPEYSYSVAWSCCNLYSRNLYVMSLCSWSESLSQQVNTYFKKQMKLMFW